jgi:hypothetical protein
MNLHSKIKAFFELGQWIEEDLLKNEAILTKAYYHNRWFTVENIKKSLQAIAHNFLNEEKINNWLKNYNLSEEKNKNIGIVMAGNLPLVGFHDLLCVLVSGNNVVIKLSSKDTILLPLITDKLIELNAEFSSKIMYAEILKKIDAVIATGGNNSARYFDYYFGKYPNIIRKNRNSVALLNGTETKEELIALGEDVFSYFGMGCRNVSFLLTPKNYNIVALLEVWEGKFNYIMDENSYKNNYDYNRTLLLMNSTEHLASDYVMIRKTESISSPIATLHYCEYDSVEEAKAFIESNSEHIQCVVTNETIANATSFGKSQQPQLHDYADNIDTLNFLTSLK